MPKKSKVTGGLKKDWISVVKRSNNVKKLVGNTAKSVFQDSETSMQLDGAVKGYGYSYYYGSAEKNGKNGKTFIFWPTNDLSNDDESNAFDAAKSAGLVTTEEAKAARRK